MNVLALSSPYYRARTTPSSGKSLTILSQIAALRGIRIVKRCTTFSRAAITTAHHLGSTTLHRFEWHTQPTDEPSAARRRGLVCVAAADAHTVMRRVWIAPSATTRLQAALAQHTHTRTHTHWKTRQKKKKIETKVRSADPRNPLWTPCL